MNEDKQESIEDFLNIEWEYDDWDDLQLIFQSFIMYEDDNYPNMSELEEEINETS